MRCDVCGQPATVHTGHIRGGKRSESHRCPGHADKPDDGPMGTLRQVMTDSAVSAPNPAKPWWTEFFKPPPKP